MVFLIYIEFKKALHTYSIQNGGNLKLKSNEKKRLRSKCKNKDCPWVILGSLDSSIKNFGVKTCIPIHKYCQRIRNKMCDTMWIIEHYKVKIMSLQSN